jgi:hypothetical protein
MKTRLCGPDDLPDMIRILNLYKCLYGIDMDSSGIRELHKTAIINSISHPHMSAIAAVDDSDNILGFCLQKFTRANSWIIRCCYIDYREGETQYNASKIGGKILEGLCLNAEARNCFNFYYVVRDIGRKRLDMTLNATELVKEKYNIDDIEHIPPFTNSKNESISKFILGHINGKNAKPVIIRHGYLKKN